MADQLIQFCLMGIAVGTATLAVTYSHLTKPVRHAMIDAPFMLGELFSCPFCFSFWAALPAAYALGGNIGVMVMNWLIVTGLSCLFIGILLKLFLFREGENEELREIVREQREVIKELLEDQSSSEDKSGT